jgi:phosphoglycerate kinase
MKRVLPKALILSQQAVAKTRGGVGGGDTIAAVSKTNFDPEKVFLSTGGGAMLEFLVSGTLPGLEPLGD